MICGTFMRNDLVMRFFVYTRQQDKTDYTEQDKAQELTEPQQPAQGLAIGQGRDIIKRDGLLYEQRISANATGRHDHPDAAHCQYAQRIGQPQAPGFADGKKTDPGTEQIQAPDANGIYEE